MPLPIHSPELTEAFEARLARFRREGRLCPRCLRAAIEEQHSACWVCIELGVAGYQA